MQENDQGEEWRLLCVLLIWGSEVWTSLSYNENTSSPVLFMKKLLIGVGTVIVLAVAWYLISPLFLDTVVDEQLLPSTSGLTDSEKMKIEKIESLTQEQVEAMPEAERMEAKRTMEELRQKMPDTVADEPMASQPTVEVSGTFKDADSFHRGSGKATIYALPDGGVSLIFW